MQSQETRNVALTPDERAAVPNQRPVFNEPPDPSEAEQVRWRCRSEQLLTTIPVGSIPVGSIAVGFYAFAFLKGFVTLLFFKNRLHETG